MSQTALGRGAFIWCAFLAKKGNRLVYVVTYFLFRFLALASYFRLLRKDGRLFIVSFYCLLGLGKSWVCVEFSMTLSSAPVVFTAVTELSSVSAWDVLLFLF